MWSMFHSEKISQRELKISVSCSVNVQVILLSTFSFPLAVFLGTKELTACQNRCTVGKHRCQYDHGRALAIVDRLTTLQTECFVAIRWKADDFIFVFNIFFVSFLQLSVGLRTNSWCFLVCAMGGNWFRPLGGDCCHAPTVTSKDVLRSYVLYDYIFSRLLRRIEES